MASRGRSGDRDRGDGGEGPASSIVTSFIRTLEISKGVQEEGRSWGQLENHKIMCGAVQNCRLEKSSEHVFQEIFRESKFG